MPLTAGLIIAGGAGLAKTAFGLFSANSAKNDMRNATRPLYSIPKEWYDDDNIAANQAQYGLSAPALNYYTTGSQRGLSSGLGAILQGGGSVNTVGGLYDDYNTGLNKIAAEDTTLRDSHIQNLISANANLANEKDKQWTLNEYEPFKDRMKADSAKYSAGMQNTFNGLQDAGNALTAYSKSKNGTDKTDGTVTRQSDLDSSSIDDPSVAPVNPTGAYQDINGANAMTKWAANPAALDYLRSLQINNPNSPYVQGLIKGIRQPQLN